MGLRAGTQLGPYEILSAIGAGGMGEVYRARDTRLDRVVAIKILPDHLSDRAELRERFEREAQTVASLNHSHICTLHDIGRQDGTDYLVMEYLEGETLAQRLMKGPLPLDQVLRYAIEIADALDKAHRKGITHRDLKPGNIMLTKSGTKLLDFGLAKLKQEVAPANVQLSQLPTAGDPLTAQGTIVGTLQYMAPEQLEGKEVDSRTDIFAFGTVVYEMATGKKAFEGKSQASLIAKILETDPPPMSLLQPMTPPLLDRVVRRCLAKEPDQRWQSANDLANELKWIAEGGSQTLIPAPIITQRKSRERLAWSLGAVFLIAALALSAVLLLQTPKPALPLQAALFPPKDHTFSVSFAISPDGKKIAFVVSDSSSGNGMLWVRSLDSTTAQPLAGSDGAAAPFWSPDSGSIGFFSGNNLKKIDVGGGPVITLAAIGQVYPQGATWSTDGTIVFTKGTLGDGLYQVASSGGPVTSLTHYDKNRGENNHRWPFFLPDGRHLLFEVLLGRGTVPEIRVLDVKTKKQIVLLSADSDAQFANGYLLCIQQGNLMAQPFDPASLKLSGASIPVAQQVSFNENGSKGAFSSGPSGLLAFQSGNIATNQLVWYSRDGKETGQVGRPGQYDAVSLSPDGTKVATSLLDVQTRTRDIWVFELARSIATRVTVDGMTADWPVWSRDGSKLIYWDTERGAGIYAKSPSGLGGSEQVQQVAQGGTGAAPNGISPDGKFLVYAMFAGSARQRLWIHTFGSEKLDTKDNPLLRTNFQEDDAQFSPDGHWLAYTSEETDKEEIYVVPFPSLSSKLQISTSGGSQPRWPREGKEIYYIAPDGKMMAVAVEISGDSFKADSPKALFQTRSVAVAHAYHQYDVTADGQKFLINSSREQDSEPITLYANWAAELKK